MAATQNHVGPADHGRKTTPGEFRGAEEEPGYRYEPARGMLEVVEIPKAPHRRIVSNPLRLAAAYEREHPGLIDLFGGGTEVRTWKAGIDLARHPDFGIVSIDAPLDDEGDLQPYLVAEIVSANSEVRESREKRRDYLVYGVREYWTADPLRRRFTALTRRGEGADACNPSHPCQTGTWSRPRPS